MVAAHGEELAWYRQMASKVAVACGAQTGKDDISSKMGFSSKTPAQWGDFDLVDLSDAMEQGLCRLLLSNYTEPPEVGIEKRLLVRRSRDRREYLLTNRDGDDLLFARAGDASASRFDIYIPGGTNPPCALGPAFTLTAGKAPEQWSLRSWRCGRCEALGRRTCGTPELLRVSRYHEIMKDVRALCIDVHVPEEASSWCQMCGDPEDRGAKLGTRRPKWDARAKGLVLDFFGRCKVASSKNIIIDGPERLGRSKECELLFGKLEADVFALEFRAPLSTAQAFGLVLTMMNCT